MFMKDREPDKTLDGCRHIHFVCTGNIYRSRLADAYLRSQQLPNIETSSSGIEAVQGSEPLISPVAAILLARAGLGECASLYPSRTSAELLAKVDLVVFMRRHHYLVCSEEYRVSLSNYEIWDIPDLNELSYSTPDGSLEHQLEIMRNAAKTFEDIKTQVDQLKTRLPGYFA
jgi:protein-tyrosine phosphatase